MTHPREPSSSPSSNGRRTRAHRRQEERRSQILAAARELIEREGYARMTMSAVAKAAGVSRPTLFNYVPSRAALRGEDRRDAPEHLGGRAGAVR
ncbi:MAG: helix-turn-helix transcriptional regulator [Chloroflexi bacterium]|nr:helix-turn-helix transcriptional regulator [Chloroflexota bacterium]